MAEQIIVLPVGTRIECRTHPELRGTITKLEYKTDKVLSALPYYITWDDEDAAKRLRGWFFFWGSDDTIEEETNEANNPN